MSLSLVSATRTCPQWCTDHDTDTGLCVGTTTDLTYLNARPAGDTLTTASLCLMQGPNETEPTVSLVLNAPDLDLTGQQVKDLAVALLCTLGKAGL